METWERKCKKMEKREEMQANDKKLKKMEERRRQAGKRKNGKDGESK